jgi:preprotein translocase subunit SecF
VEILRAVSIDWIGKKWYFIGVSLAAFALGVIGYLAHGGFSPSIDFTGGTIVYVKFAKSPDIDMIRSALKPESVGATVIQRYDAPEKNSVQIRIQGAIQGNQQELDAGPREVRRLLLGTLDPTLVGKTELDFNAIGADALASYLKEKDPDNLKSQSKTAQESDDHYNSMARTLLDYRDRTMDGLVNSINDLAKLPGIGPPVVQSLAQGFYAAPFAVKGVDSVGAIVGSDLRRRATLAVGLSLLGMLVYMAFRFKPIYGVAATVALIHDVLITLGFFAITQKEVSLIVIAALLTLVGYSVNDTIVIFDRVRENLRLYRKESLTQILNLSINQTLSRTILTSGFTFLSVLALFLFGGEVLNGFAFALTVGFIIGSYSTITIASPIVDAWYRYSMRGPKRKAA